jgi:hypothetical protein
MPQTSVTPNGQKLHPHQFIGRQCTYQRIYIKTYSTEKHKEGNNTPCVTHTSATLIPNFFPDQASITACVQLCHNLSSWVTLMKVRNDIKYVTVLKSCAIYCTIGIKSTTPDSNVIL